MTVYAKRSGAWVAAQEAWMRQSGTWKQLDSVWTKWNGVWQASVVPSNAMPAPPLLSLQVINNRYIDVGMKYPGLYNEPSVRIMQVNVARDSGVLTTQYGSGSLPGNSAGYPDENWSLWHYVEPAFVGGQVHGDTSIVDHKAYPNGAAQDATMQLPTNQRFYFAAWTKNARGIWSQGVFQNILVPTGDVVTGIIKKQANFQAYNAGTFINGTTLDEAFVSPTAAANDLQVMPTGATSAGAWFYGNQVTSAYAQDGPATINRASIRITRDNDEGPPSANVTIFWHGTATPGYIAVADRMQPTKVGTLAKGQSAAFDIPAAWYSHLNTGLKGIGVDMTRPTATATDQARFLGPMRDYRSGNLTLEWDEQT